MIIAIDYPENIMMRNYNKSLDGGALQFQRETLLRHCSQ